MDKQIKENLAENQDLQQGIPQDAPKIKKGIFPSKIVAGIIIISIITAISLGLYFVKLSSNTRKLITKTIITKDSPVPTITQSVNKTITTKVSPTPTSSKFVKWQECVGDKFSVNYPPSWDEDSPQEAYSNIIVSFLTKDYKTDGRKITNGSSISVYYDSGCVKNFTENKNILLSSYRVEKINSEQFDLISFGGIGEPMYVAIPNKQFDFCIEMNTAPDICSDGEKCNEDVFLNKTFLKNKDDFISVAKSFKNK